MKTTLFIPIRNEIDGLKQILPMIKKEWVDEIIFVDGNSTDGSFEYLKNNGYFVIKQKSKGTCGAYWECCEVAKGDIIIAFSPDGNSLPELIPILAEKMKDGYDMVIASRYADGAKSYDDDFITAFGNWMFTQLVNVLFSARYTDSIVMFRAFKKNLLSQLELTSGNLPVLEMQLTIGCAKKKLKVLDIPGDEPIRIGGVRKMNPLINGCALLWCVFWEWITWRRQSNVYGKNF
ncbi:MAG: glycosyltransferase family 2 protein [Elusimicrobia bacterium]|nr:glycosyltransferase family 2 protein [Elusimicrobiota bacterium]